MKKLQLPASYAALSPEEQRTAFGGSEFGDAVGSFFDNLHFGDFFWEGGLLSFSFTFVPMLFFRMIKVGVQTGIKLYQQFARLLGVTSEAPLPSSIWTVSNSRERIVPLQTLSLSPFLCSSKP